MADIDPTLPAINEPNSTADPKVRAALVDIVAAVNNLGTANLADSAVTTAKIATAAVTDAKLASPILRGVVNSDGTIAQGTGFTVTKGSTGVYTITFTTAYSAAPIALVGSASGTAFLELVTTTTTTLVVNLYTWPTASADAALGNAKFNFIVIPAA